MAKQRKQEDQAQATSDSAATPVAEPATEVSGPAAEEAAAVEAQPDAAVAEERLRAAEAKASEHWDQFLRAKAEVENLRRRSERDLENAHKYALERISADLLPVVDSLELGLAAVSAEDAGAGKLQEGMELTLKMLLGVMEKYAIRPVDPSGERFDPQFHQAMTTQPASHVEPNTVLTVFQKGYLLNDRLIRPALVVVSAAPDQEPGSKVDERA